VGAGGGGGISSDAAQDIQKRASRGASAPQTQHARFRAPAQGMQKRASAGLSWPPDEQSTVVRPRSLHLGARQWCAKTAALSTWKGWGSALPMASERRAHRTPQQFPKEFPDLLGYPP
jgi:hypothetical protein